MGIVAGTVTDAATGQPLEGVKVTTQPASASATTDATGKYAIEDVPTGIYSVLADLSGHNRGYQGMVSVTAGTSRTVNLSLTAADPFPIAKVKGVSFRVGDTATYADGQLRLTTHYSVAGEALTHNEDIIVTSGLNNVAVGQFVYLEGREDDSHGSQLSGFSWEVVGPGQTEVTGESPTASTFRFKADTQGKYTITVSATNEEGETLSSSLIVYAGKYVGGETCATCHSGSVMPDIVTPWRETGHATKLETAFPMYTATRDYCIACHTTGYDETDTAGGFDDLARLAGWDGTESLTTWLVNNNWTVDDILASPMGKLANIQCESCHGPGSVHTEAKSFETGVCNQCHPQGNNWKYSGHANTGSKEMHMAESGSCVACHTGQGFVQVKIRGKSPVFPHQATPDNPATLPAPGEMAPVACATCHDPHAFTYPEGGKSHQLRVKGEVTMPNGVTVNAEESAVCVMCHSNKRDVQYFQDYMAGKKSRGPHHNAQADVFYGVGAVTYGETFSNSAHTTRVKEGCIQCHMASSPVLAPGPDGKVGTRDDVKAPNVGDHSWTMAATWEGAEVANTGACMASGCHASGSITTFNRKAFGDYDGDGTVEGVQDEVKGLLALLEEKLPKVDGKLPSSGINKLNWTKAQLAAFWNYQLISGDGSYGVHNTRFAVKVLQETYKQLTGSPVPGAAAP